MEILQISIRNNFLKDGLIEINAIPGAKVVDIYGFQIDSPAVNANTAEAYYPHSKITIGQDVLDAINQHEPRDSLEKLQMYYSRSFLIHEFVHYYQTKFWTKAYINPMTDRCGYYRQPIEREAYVTQYLYIIKHCFPDEYPKFSAITMNIQSRWKEIVTFGKKNHIRFDNCPEQQD